jgi:hypothetical protein
MNRIQVPWTTLSKVVKRLAVRGRAQRLPPVKQWLRVNADRRLVELRLAVDMLPL